MAAFALSLLIFLSFALAGAGFLSLIKFREGLLRCWLISPAVGYGLVLLLVSMPNVYGFPVGSYSGIVLGIAFFFILAGINSARKMFPVRQMLMISIILLVLFLYQGWPLFLYGFEWVGMANGDASHFAIIAERLIEQPLFYQPTFDDLAGYNMATLKVFHHALGGDRFGTEMLLAWISCLTNKAPLQIYMPVILAVSAMGVTSLGGLVLQGGKFRFACYLSMGLTVLSPLYAFGVFVQLLPQAGGVALMLVLFTLFSGFIPSLRSRLFFRHGMVSILLASSLCILYPEVTPFLAIALLFYWLVKGFRQSRSMVSPLLMMLLTGVGMAVLLNRAFALMLAFMFYHRIPGALSDMKESTFPYYLIPSGLPALFGFQIFNKVYPGLWQDILVILGFIVFGATFLGCWKSFKHKHPLSFLAGSMLFIWVYLVIEGNGFGAFKMAMYIQPVLWGIIAISLSLIFKKHRRYLYGILCFLLLMEIPSYLQYVKGTLVSGLGRYQDSRGSSAEGVSGLDFDKNQKLYIDLPNKVFQTWLNSSTAGNYSYNANRVAMGVENVQYDHLTGSGTGMIDCLIQSQRMESPILKQLLAYAGPGKGFSKRLRDKREEVVRKTARVYSLLGTHTVLSRHPGVDHFDDFFYVGLDPEKSLFNGLNTTDFEKKKVFRIAPLSELKNYVVFINSTAGWQQSFGERHHASVYPAQPDLYHSGKAFFRVGKSMLLQVLNPSEKFRLRVSYTRSLNSKGYKSLEDGVLVRGEETVVPELRGAGAANVYSPLLSAKSVEGMHFIFLQFNSDCFQFSNVKHRLMNLYGKEYGLDIAWQIGFARDISVVTEEEYLQAARPLRLETFPGDLLANPFFEFSGIYEDGWLSQESYCVFGASKKGQRLRLKGHLPGHADFLNKEITLHVRINNQMMKPVSLVPGDINMTFPIERDADRTKVDLVFSDSFVASDVDPRVLSFLVYNMGIE